MNNKTLLENLRCIPDFPKKGINFRDVTTLFGNSECLQIMEDELYDIYKNYGITKIVGIESRGFVMASALAVKLHAGVVLCRKPGKLPGDTVQESFSKEYGEDTIEIHNDSISENDVVLLHDDLLATGGTMKAAYNLCDSAVFFFVIQFVFHDLQTFGVSKQCCSFSKIDAFFGEVGYAPEVLQQCFVVHSFPLFIVNVLYRCLSNLFVVSH